MDGKLSAEGAAEARDLRMTHPQLENVQLVLTSPMRRCMETAVLAFQGHKAERKVIIDKDLIEVGNSLNFEQGKQLFEETGRRDLLLAYSELWGDTRDYTGAKQYWSPPASDGTEVRWRRFEQRLRLRQENFIAVVAHHGVYSSALNARPGMGEMVTREMKESRGKLLHEVPGVP